ncbi:MAG: bacteriohemerythrin [Spirochaetaceae bacterium]|jgi:hemerythrin|nr:bacteriohemerythrin [Spirochaetaceae bacterium]
MQTESVVEWDDSYSVGVELIDNQHRELIKMTNDLFAGCQKGGTTAEMYFMKTIQGAVKYVKTHFSTEEIIMERLKYPDFLVHKKEHENFVAKVLKEVKDFEGAKNFVPLDFARYLQDWVLTHIALSDKKYGVFFNELKSKGALDESMLVV